jgi:hypothetical protein
MGQSEPGRRIGAGSLAGPPLVPFLVHAEAFRRFGLFVRACQVTGGVGGQLWRTTNIQFNKSSPT